MGSGLRGQHFLAGFILQGINIVEASTYFTSKHAGLNRQHLRNSAAVALRSVSTSEPS